MKLHNPGGSLFKELEGFLRYYYNDIDTPISIMRQYFDEPQIVFNTEQLTIPDLFNNIMSYKNSNIIEIWDYSLSNINILNSVGINNTKHIPLKIWPEYKKKLDSLNTDNTYYYDVGFCGWTGSARRRSILELIKNSGMTLDIIEGGVFGEDRDKRLAKCKILLNIHFDTTYKIFEQLRCFPWIDTGKTVVSENSLDNDPRCVNVEYEDLVPTLLGLLK